MFMVFPFFILIFIAFICLVVVMGIVANSGKRSPANQMSSQEERQFEALISGLDRMERRVDNLETILHRGN